MIDRSDIQRADERGFHERPKPNAAGNRNQHGSQEEPIGTHASQKICQCVVENHKENPRYKKNTKSGKTSPRNLGNGCLFRRAEHGQTKRQQQSANDQTRIRQERRSVLKCGRRRQDVLSLAGEIGDADRALGVVTRVPDGNRIISQRAEQDQGGDDESSPGEEPLHS